MLFSHSFFFFAFIKFCSIFFRTYLLVLRFQLLAAQPTIITTTPINQRIPTTTSKTKKIESDRVVFPEI